MKKFLVFLLLIVVIGAIAIVYILRSSSGFRSIYLIPEDAVYIIESDNPVKAWDEIIHSNLWNQFSNNDFFSDLNDYIFYYDSLIGSNKMLLQLMGKKSVLVSQHPIGNNKYDFLYIFEVGKFSKYKSPEKLIKSILGDDYEITSRDYKGEKIIEILDREEEDYYFISFVKGKMIFSFKSALVEASIDEIDRMRIGRDTKFLEVKSKIGNNGQFNVYINHHNLNRIFQSLSPESRSSFSESTKGLEYSAVSFQLNKEGLIAIEGFTSYSDSIPNAYINAFYNGPYKLYSADVIPLRVASLVKINFDDPKEYFFDVMKGFGEAEFNAYQNNIIKTEKRLKINLEKNLFSWMKDEMILLQTKPSNLGRDNEFAVILQATDSTDAADNLQFIFKQIRKNSPIKIKEYTYRNYPIQYIAFPGILKLLFGKALKKIEKPYFVQLGDNVIISNHPQTLKNIIDDYLSGTTLKSTDSYTSFAGIFDNNSSVFFYSQPPILYSNLKGMVTINVWNKIQKNKKYITCFSEAGLQINKDDNLLHFLVKAQYSPDILDYQKQFYDGAELISQFSFMDSNSEELSLEKPEADTIPAFYISDLDANKYELFYDDGTLKLTVKLKRGNKHGDFEFYYPSGEVHIKGQYNNDVPTGTWKYYGEDGELIKTDNY